MERAANISLGRWHGTGARSHALVSPKTFAAILITSAGLSAAVAGLLPLQVSIVSVFLFAGPHNWFELRYFLMRLPIRFGKSRAFFLTAFSGVGCLTVAYVSLPLLYQTRVWSYEI